MADVWQFLLSLLAIGGLVLLVQRLRLGGTAALTDDNDARRAADMAVDGFAATQLSIGADGAAAILRDADGRILLLRQHGAHVAGRLLDAGTDARLTGDVLQIVTSDPRFGSVSLVVPDGPAWKARIDELRQGRHA